MKAFFILILFSTSTAFSQDADISIKPVKGIHLDFSIGGKALTSYKVFNDSLINAGIDPLSLNPQNLSFSFGFYHKKSDFQLNIFTGLGNNGKPDSSYALNLGLYGFNLEYGYNLGHDLKRWSFKPFAGIGLNAMQLTGRNNGDSTLTYSEFVNDNYNLYFNRSSPQLNLELGFMASLFWLHPSPNTELFFRGSYSLGLIDYSWLRNELPIKASSGANFAFGIRFNLKRISE